MSFFRKIVDSLRKTQQVVADGIQQAVLRRPAIDPGLYDELEEILLRGDVGVATTDELLDRLRRAVRDRGVENPTEVPSLLRDVAADLLRGAFSTNVPRSESGPLVILVCGVNGVGKTTTIGKLAHRYGMAGQRTLIVAGDTFRAAACEQLAIWAERAKAGFVRSTTGADPAAVAFDGIQAGIARGSDVVIVDTAGRLQAKGNLMEELAKIRRVVGKAQPGAPHEVLLVLDATIGQNGLAQAREFLSSAGVTGLVLAKLDGTAKGGVVLAIARETSLPVRYVGLGEGIDDLADFDPDAFADALIRGDR
jgi:fused signal recognition particle receptor